MLETLVRHLDMVRLTIVGSCLLVMVGCSGLVDTGGGGGLTPEAALARKAWLEKALPTLTANCLSCHNGSRANIGFMEGTGDLVQRDALMAYTPSVVNLDAPSSSRLMTKGAHEGPPLDAVQTSNLLEWVQAEHDAAIPDPGVDTAALETEKFIPQMCTGGVAGVDPTCPINTVALDTVGDGVVGAKISFVVQALGSGLYVTNLKLIPGTGGAFIEHPLFVSWPADETLPPTFDQIDRFFNVKMNLMMTATPEEQQIGGGTAAFVGFHAGPMDKLTIHFKAAKLYQTDPGSGGGGGGDAGCKKLDLFKAGAQGPLNTNCRSCHGGQDANATSAMNITGVDGTDDPTLQAACNQVRTRVNFQTIDQSGIFLASVPGNGNHPFTFNGNTGAHDAFKTALNPWIVGERDAP